MNCTRCEGTGFLNTSQLPPEVADGGADIILAWTHDNANHDVEICDCCGDGVGWYGQPGEHDSKDYGNDGPYAYNGGLPECH